MSSRTLSLRSTPVLASLAAPVLAQCPNQRPNGYCPETTPRPGEAPIGQSQFKASHDSWSRNENLTDQVVDFNNWMIELDMHEQGGTIRVGSWDCDLGSLADFRDIDNFTWPSVPELIRRGQYYVPIVAESTESSIPFAGEDEDFSFASFSGDPDWNNPGNRLLAQRTSGCDLGGTPAAWTPNPRFLTGDYAAGACSGSCLLQDGSYWDDGINQGHNCISIDCIDNDPCVDPGVHSPMPYYVVNSGAFDHIWGALAFPRVGAQRLFKATRRVSPVMDVQISQGKYILNNLPEFILNQRTIRRPMILKNRSGAGDVVIR